MTQCAPTTSTTFRKHDVITIIVILKSGTFLSSYQVFFLFFFFLGGAGGGGGLVRSGVTAGWFLVNSHYKSLCASLCTFETVQEIEK